MQPNQMTRLSRKLSYLLRHSPQHLDRNGWARVEDILTALRERCPSFSLEDLEEIVRTDAKGRYSFDADHRRIRANQGHSVPVDVELEELPPPEVLYHGTATRFLDGIFQKGLLPMTRLYCHLSADFDTAHAVGARHGKPVVLRVDTAAMAREGYVFYRSENGVWLTKAVPPRFLTPLA